MNQLSKKLKHEFRELMEKAYEREIATYMHDLHEKFKDWEAGKIPAGELSVLIHQYDRGPSSEMFSRYNRVDPQISVARGLFKGLLKREEISDEAYQFIKDLVEFYHKES
ncbi:hypothetical protein JW824_09590 [bacterium]|nr:hypothetical protein [bacterium]RQV94342.1 MAG: hypothetical protein EH221_07790 [bacterium]